MKILSNAFNCIENEIWKNIPNYEGIYKISDYGRIKSFKFKKHKILKQNINTPGYYFVCLNNKCIMIHKLMKITFLNNIDAINMVVNHIDGNRLNNKLNNLEIITHRNNITLGMLKSKNKIKSIYTGVSFKNTKWYSYISINGKRIFLGIAESEYKAHINYQNALLNINLFDGNVLKFRKNINTINSIK